MTKDIIIIATVLLINIITMLLYAIDKRKAIKDKWRIPEKTLLLWSFFAPWGGYAGMKLMRHKTKHKKFTVLIPVFAVLHIAVLIGLIYYTKI